MKELKAIVSAWKACRKANQRFALATVVRVHGSAYRSPGARMLISDNGKWVGSISGGCLEGDALRKARTVMQENKPLLITYDTRQESNQQLGIGLGCNGVIDVLLEPVIPGNTNVLTLFENLLTRNEPVAMGIVLTGNECGKKITRYGDGTVYSEITDTYLSNQIDKILARLFTDHQSRTMQVGSEQVFAEWIQPAISLLIFGAGFDARPVCAFAKMLGWDVQVTDECISHIAPVFFPQADRLALCQRTFVDREFNITPYTACVLMSHNYEYDREVLKKILPTPTPYIGLIGPRKRFEKMKLELEQQGIVFNTDHLHRIHAPAGLDIGAETPDEIAVSLLGEIQSKFTGRSGGFLKYRSGPIHQRTAKSDEVFKQVFLTGDNLRKTRGM
ncbi:MAG: xanthine dehydrogenase [Cyclobacteriaceae bacterium]|nr:MAG: xanthine dehydrogenase [Cyclobacteriaceae bacterium]